MTPPLSPLLEAFVSAKNRHDSAAFVACFAPDAVVHDEGREHRGRPAIQAWFEDVSRKYRVTLTVTDVTSEGNNVLLTGLVAGNFEGSPLQLRYQITTAAGKITALKIAP